MAITIPENEYQLGVEVCKRNLHDRVIWPKGFFPCAKPKIQNFGPWKSIVKWGITSFGKGYFEFSFSSIKDVRRVRSITSWNLNPGFLKLFPWSKDFNPCLLKYSYAQVWVRIHGFSQEY